MSISPENLKKQVNEKLSRTSKEDVMMLIKEINDINTNTSRIKEIISDFASFIPLITMPIGQHYFYRSRYWSNLLSFPAQLSELLEPNKTEARQNRCNLEKKPVLYVSGHPDALIYECQYKPGDLYILLQFNHIENNTELDCMLLGFDTEIKFGYDKRIKEMMEYKRDFYGANIDKLLFIESEVHKQFVRTDDKNGLTYRFTANLCDYFFYSIKDLDAIVYPSIATLGSVSNSAIRPNVYHKSYEASKIGLFEVLPNFQSRQLYGALVVDNCFHDWEPTNNIDSPIPHVIKKIDPNDKRIYIAPWK